MDDPSKEARRLIEQGYRRISNTHRTVSRIDRPDWREYMASKHSPWDPKGEGMEWVRVLQERPGSAEDHYRRCYSEDKIGDIYWDVFRRIPGSNWDPVGFVPKTNREKHEFKYDLMCSTYGVGWNPDNHSDSKILGRTVDQWRDLYLEDRHLNNVPLREWDRLVSAFMVYVGKRSGLSVSQVVSMEKHACQRMLERIFPGIQGGE